MNDADRPSVAIIMGSISDWETMRHAAETLDALEIAYERAIVSAHRTACTRSRRRRSRAGCA